MMRMFTETFSRVRQVKKKRWQKCFQKRTIRLKMEEKNTPGLGKITNIYNSLLNLKSQFFCAIIYKHIYNKKNKIDFRYKRMRYVFQPSISYSRCWLELHSILKSINVIKISTVKNGFQYLVDYAFKPCLLITYLAIWMDVTLLNTRIWR